MDQIDRIPLSPQAISTILRRSLGFVSLANDLSWRMLMRFHLPVLACMAVLGSAGAASGAFYPLSCVTQNSATNCNSASQFTIEVADGGTSLGSQTVAFTFRNAAIVESSIKTLFFDQSSPFLDSFRLPTYSPGVLYLPTAKPKNLPGPVPFDTDFSLEKVGSISNGVDRSSEFATIRLALSSGNTVNDVIDAMNTGGLRIGIHVGAFANGGSEVFLSQVPEPAAYAVVLALGLLVLFWKRRSHRPESA